MKKIKDLFLTATIAIAVALAASPLTAATWNDAVGMGNAGDQIFTGPGTPITVIGSVLSNSTYYIAGARGDGTPRFTAMLSKCDLTGHNVDFLVATNTWICASNQPAGTNIIWLTGTNSVMATNDLIVLRNVTTDSYQLLVVGGGTTEATGTVITNSTGVAFKVWTTPTNTITSGDIIYKMTRLTRLNPFADFGITNRVLSPWGNWLTPLDPLATGLYPIPIAGRAGYPLVTMMNYSNAGSILVSGEYYRRPRF